MNLFMEYISIKLIAQLLLIIAHIIN